MENINKNCFKNNAISIDKESSTLVIFGNSLANTIEEDISRCGFYDNIKHIYIEKDVYRLDILSVFSLYKVESITVHPDNKHYHSSNNCLIETETKTIVLACKNSVIPDDGSVVGISQHSIKSNEPISVSIPKSISCIERLAFDCRLKSITIDPENIYYEIINNCLIDKSRKILLLSLEGGTIPTEKYVRIIGAEAFACEENLTDLHIPENIKIIERCAFDSCKNLQHVTFSEGLRVIQAAAFWNCRALHDVVFPESLEEIHDSSFSLCKSITEIKIPKNVEYIGANIFQECSNLQSVIVDSQNQYYNSIDNCLIDSVNDRLLWGSYDSIIPIGTKSIESGAFEGCNNLRQIKIPDTVTIISDSAFMDCDNLEYVYIPEGVSLIGSEAFCGCNSLRSIRIPAGVSRIEPWSFSYCSSIGYIKIPGNVKSIEADAFASCDLLESVTILEGVTSIGDGAFRYCDLLEYVTIPESVTFIHPRAFDGCKNIAFRVTKDSYAEKYVNQLINSDKELQHEIIGVI